MTWNKIIGQNRVKKILQKAIIENKIPHAYCLWGQEGIGKDALAIEFARVVNCQSPVKTENGIEPCENCHSCRASALLQHRNIHLIFPMPTGKSGDTKKDSVLERLTEEQVEEYHEQVKLKSDNPYHKITITNANQIRIASVRELKKKLVLTSSGEGRVCVIVMRADEMTTEAANAFLKTLEEPHENVTILMTTSGKDTILPTILSRCQQIRCEPLNDKEISEALKERNNIAEHEASLISAFAQGSYTRAVEYLGEAMHEMRESAIDFLRSLLKKKMYRVEVMEHIEKFTKKHDRRDLEILLSMMLIWMRDVINLSKTGKTGKIINKDQSETIQKFVAGYPNKDYEKTVEVLEKSINQLRKNVAPQLVMIRTALDFRRLFLFS
ncbi:MAG: hypothetical protein EPN82_13510 [Bacteroidetes bacterium]|nr:MAG: hypothetical protein EPN82_13510 [Bacteroidota bacterium]